MNCINVMWHSVDDCIGGIDKENRHELLRSGLYTNRKLTGSSTKFYRYSHRMLWISVLRKRDFVPDYKHGFCSDHVLFFMQIRSSFLQHKILLLGQISHDPVHPDWVPSLFILVDSRSREKLKRKLNRYFQTTATKTKNT